MNKTHTETPWIQSFDDFDEEVHITSQGRGDAIDPIARVDVGYTGVIGEEQTANADFIVTACNSHAALVEALEGVTGCSRALRHGGPDQMDLQDLSDALNEATEIAAQALSLARGDST